MPVVDTARALEANLKGISKRLGISMSKVIRKTAFDLQKKIILRTPIDTGRHAASWGMSVNTPGGAVQPDGEYPSPVAMARSLTNLPGANAGLEDFREVWVWNNGPAIGKLEFGGYPGDGPRTIGGFSTQAPAGMARISIVETALELQSIGGPG